MELAILALATWEVVELWHHGSIFADWRAQTELWDYPWRTLFSCPFCLAPWTALVLRMSASKAVYIGIDTLVGVIVLHEIFNARNRLPWPYLLTVLAIGLLALAGIAHNVFDTHLLGLAAARLANLGNDLFHERCRTPGRHDIQQPGIEDGGSDSPDRPDDTDPDPAA